MSNKVNYNKMFEEPAVVEHVDDVVEEIAEMIEPETEVEEVVNDNTEIGVVDCKCKLNIRVAPYADADVVKEIAKGAEVMVYLDESTDDFYKVCTESGVEGFCMKKFINI